ncbi:MAG: hypothetical protein IBX43_10895 [Campylobacterales bacterium]|nr:hypothetical protein [Campylobacterales bacterium]
MKVMEKIDVVVKLKEKIAEAKSHNAALAEQLQKLLDALMISPPNKRFL